MYLFTILSIRVSYHIWRLYSILPLKFTPASSFFSNYIHAIETINSNLGWPHLRLRFISVTQCPLPPGRNRWSLSVCPICTSGTSSVRTSSTQTLRTWDLAVMSVSAIPSFPETGWKLWIKHPPCCVTTPGRRKNIAALADMLSGTTSAKWQHVFSCYGDKVVENPP